MRKRWQAARASRPRTREERVQHAGDRRRGSEHESRTLEQRAPATAAGMHDAQVSLAKVEERLDGLRPRNTAARDADLDSAARSSAQAQRQHLDGQRGTPARQPAPAASVSQAITWSTGQRSEKQPRRRSRNWNGSARAAQDRARLASAGPDRPRHNGAPSKSGPRRASWRSTTCSHRGDTAGRPPARRLPDRAGRAVRSDWQERRADATAAEPDWRTASDANAAQEEIDELHRKLSRLGSVNLDALQELNELETRASTLQDAVRRPDRGQAVAGRDHRQDQPATAGGCSPRRFDDDPHALPGAVPQALRRRHGRHRAGGRERHPRERHRDHRPPARQGAAQHLADVRRREDA